MTPAVEALAAAPAAAPSLLGAALRMVGALVLLGVSAWVVLRWQRNVRGARRQMEVLDRAVLTRGASVAILRVEGRRLLLGVSADGVRLLGDLDSPSDLPSGTKFRATLSEASAAAATGAEP
ncbi:MAG: flagellar biosynthetic protein FliO [Acidobacteriia bacterium]|nr:flagellar biosynthetic protein FliO [Terriglobia bacterium]